MKKQKIGKLCLTVKFDEVICVGEDIYFTLRKCSSNQVQLSIVAPIDQRIRRYDAATGNEIQRPGDSETEDITIRVDSKDPNGSNKGSTRSSYLRVWASDRVGTEGGEE